MLTIQGLTIFKKIACLANQVTCNPRFHSPKICTLQGWKIIIMNYTIVVSFVEGVISNITFKIVPLSLNMQGQKVKGQSQKHRNINGKTTDLKIASVMLPP